MKPASWPVDLPVRKGQLTREEQKHKDMQDTVKEFSFGALGNYGFSSDKDIEIKPIECTEGRVLGGMGPGFERFIDKTKYLLKNVFSPKLIENGWEID